DSALGCLLIAHFADQHHVGVVTQNAAQRRPETQTDLVMYLNLADPILHVFDRVLDRDDFEGLVLDLVEGRVERGAFAGAGGTGYQDYAVRQIDQLLENVVGVGQHADVGEIEDHAALVEQTHDDAFAVSHRDDGNTDIDLAAADAHL